MGDWADEFFRNWQKAWNTGTEAVLEYVTDDIEYWDVTLEDPIRGREAYATYCDGFFAAFTELDWTMREPVIHQGDRVAEPWAFKGLNSGPLWIGLPATGRRIETKGTDIFEFRDGKVCREHSFYDVTSNLRQLGLWPGIDSIGERLIMGAGAGAVHASRLIGRIPVPGL